VIRKDRTAIKEDRGRKGDGKTLEGLNSAQQGWS